MNDPIEDLAAQSLAEYAKTLRSVRPSAQLDARMHRTFRSFESRARRERYVRLAMAAGLGAIAVGGAIFVGRLKVHEYVAHVSSQAAGAGMPPQVGQVSPWPGRGAVFRVRASAATLALGSHFDPGPGEPEFWIDVRVGNDGSMRILRIIPVGGILSIKDSHLPIDVIN